MGKEVRQHHTLYLIIGILSLFFPLLILYFSNFIDMLREVFNFSIVGQANPTLSILVYTMSVMPVLEVIALIFFGIISILYAKKKFPTTTLSKTAVILVIIALSIEFFTFLPCILSLINLMPGDGLCGFFYLIFSKLTAIVIIIALIMMVITTKNKTVRIIGVILPVIIILVSIIIIKISTPQSPTECAQLDNEFNRETCYNNFALKNKDPKLCEQITSLEPLRNICYNELARILGDPELCQHVEPHRDTCYLMVASFSKDRTICENIEDESLKQQCILKMPP